MSPVFWKKFTYAYIYVICPQVVKPPCFEVLKPILFFNLDAIKHLLLNNFLINLVIHQMLLNLFV